MHSRGEESEAKIFHSDQVAVIGFAGEGEMNNVNQIGSPAGAAAAADTI